MYSEPWFRKHDGWWYCYVREGGKRRQLKLVRGKANREAAYDKWHKLCAKPVDPPVVAGESAVGLLDLFLEWCQKNRAQGTYDIYLHHITSFSRSVGADMAVTDLKPKHVTIWLDTLKVADSTKAGAAQTIRTAFHWLVREGYISANPVAGAKAPSKRGREVILTDDQYKALLENSRPDFCTLLEFIRATGCRPQEAVAAEASHCQLDERRLVFPPSKAEGKKCPRVIYLNDRALAIVSELCRKHPQGKLFRSSNGKPWNRI